MARATPSTCAGKSTWGPDFLTAVTRSLCPAVRRTRPQQAWPGLECPAPRWSLARLQVRVGLSGVPPVHPGSVDL